jgi:outer membrane cobalamin receptor
MRKRYLFFFLFILFAFSLDAQQLISGRVIDENTGEPLIGALVVADSSNNVSVTDVDGNYSLKLNDGTHALQVKYTGYTHNAVNITVAGKPMNVDLPAKSNTLKEVQIVADIVIDRKTPVAVSNVGELKIREEAAGRDITMLLNSTPGAYASEQGGGAGDSRVNVRGADQRNVGVMVDGVPMNDMENGQVYWSNWSGLMDVTRTMQVQRGLGASKLAIPSVGGTINILTRGLDQRRSFVFKSEIGNNSLQKYYVGFNSGEFGNGWGVTLAGSRRTAQGWVDQTWDDQWAYFAKVEKRIGNHLLSFGMNGAPQSHGQRSDRMPVAVIDRGYALDIGANVDSVYALNGYTTMYQGERGRQFNPNWGYINYADGQQGRLNQSTNFYNKPLGNLSWFWNPNEKFSLSTVLYYSHGYGGGTNFNSAPNRDTTTGQQNLTQVYTLNSTTIDALYSSSETKSTRALLASMNNHTWFGGISTARWNMNENLGFTFGIDARHYKGSHYRMVYDLVGGDYYIDVANKNQPNGIGNLQYSMKRDGDTVGYFNDSYVNWQGLFAQSEYSKGPWSTFVTLTGSLSTYQRFDHFKKRDITLEDGTVVPMIVGYNEVYYTNGTESAVAMNNAVITTYGDTLVIDNPSGPNDTLVGATAYAWSSDAATTAKTDKKTIPGFTVKTGANYNINDNYNVFVNVGYMSLAPRFNQVFDNNNKPYPGKEDTLLSIGNTHIRKMSSRQQKIYSAELGFGARFSSFAANLNLYYTNWMNKAPYGSPTTNIGGDNYTYDLGGLNTILMGVEIDANWKPLKQLQVEGLLSLGNWKYSSAGRVYLYDANYALEDSIDYSAKGVHLGDAAQTQIGGSVRYEPIDGLYFRARYTYFANYYANFDPIILIPLYNSSGNLVGDNRDHESWQLPSYGLVDLFGGYEYRDLAVGEKDKQIKISFNFGITNLLDTKYISDAQNGAQFDSSSSLVYMGLGRRWVAGIRFSF